MTLPQIVLNAILPIGGTLAGVIIGSLLTNRAQRDRLREQLEHDARERSREREMGLRREVYLKAAEAACASITLISRLGNPTVPEKELEDSASWINAALGKIPIIASDQTIDAVSRFSKCFAVSSLLLLKKRILLNREEVEITSLGEQMSALAEEAKRLAGLLQEDASDDVDGREVIECKYQEGMDQWKTLFAEKDKRDKLYGDHLLDLANDCASYGVQLSKLLVPAVCAVRRELALPFDESAYARLVEEQACSTMNVVKAYLSDLKEIAGTKSD